MTPILTATIQSLITGDIQTEVVYLAFDGSSLLAMSLALLLISIVFLAVCRFELWALTMVVIIAILSGPFALTGLYPYWLVFGSMGFLVALVLKFLVHDLPQVGKP